MRKSGPRAWVPADHENRLAEFRTEAGFTIKDLAEKAGKGWASLRAVELCESPPIDKSGSLKPWLADVCKIMGRAVEDVFPHQFCAWRPDEFTPDQAYGSIMCREPQDVDDVIDVRRAVAWLYKKKPRNAGVLWARCLGYSVVDIAAAMNLSTAAVSRLERIALRLLRGPGRIGDERDKKENKVTEPRLVKEEDKDSAPKLIPANEWPHMKLRRRPEPVSDPVSDKRAGMIWSERARWVRGGRVGPEPK